MKFKIRFTVHNGHPLHKNVIMWNSGHMGRGGYHENNDIITRIGTDVIRILDQYDLYKFNNALWDCSTIDHPYWNIEDDDVVIDNGYYRLFGFTFNFPNEKEYLTWYQRHEDDIHYIVDQTITMKRKNQIDDRSKKQLNFEFNNNLTKYAYVELSTNAVPLGNPNRKPIKNGHLLPTNPNRTEELGLIPITITDFKFSGERQ